MERYKVGDGGSIIEVKRGEKYRIRFKYQDTHTGEWQYAPQRTVKGNKERAREELAFYKHNYIAEKNDLITDKTVGGYAREWHEYRVDMELAQPLTLDRENISIKRIEELFSGTLLVELTPKDIEKALRTLKDRGLSDCEIRRFFDKLNQIMKEALQRGDIKVSPCSQMKPPKKPKDRKRGSLTEDQVVQLATSLQTAPRNGKIVAVWLVLALGLRRGEALGLRWMDIDLEKSIVHIVNQYDKDHRLREPKCSSKRDLSIADGVTIDFLKEWKRMQSIEFFDCGEVPDDLPVCTNEIGDFLDTAAFDKWRRRFFVELGLATYGEVTVSYDSKGNKRYRRKGYSGPCLHALRHTQATLLIAKGMDIKTVQHRLGHSSASMTIDTYAHAVPGKEQEVASTFGRILNLEAV